MKWIIAERVFYNSSKIEMKILDRSYKIHVKYTVAWQVTFRGGERKK